jgi:hypothetical protein
MFHVAQNRLVRAAFINVAQSFSPGSRHPQSADDLRRGAIRKRRCRA